ncbi:hypothetical protein ACWHA1_36700, partial [Streptomyces decoyicus]
MGGGLRDVPTGVLCAAPLPARPNSPASGGNSTRLVRDLSNAAPSGRGSSETSAVEEDTMSTPPDPVELYGP